MYANNEVQEVLEVNARLDERINREQTDIEGERTTVIYKGYGSRHLYKIEKFVNDIVEKGWKGGFIEELTRFSKIPKIRELYLGKKYYPLLNSLFNQYSDRYYYSARVEAFYDVGKEMGMVGSQSQFEFGLPGEVDWRSGIRYMDWFNEIIERVRVRCQTLEFKERERLRAVNAERNKRNVLALEEAMFSEETGRSRWLILSLTLRYKPKYRRWITSEMIQQHRDRFLKARRFNSLMSGIQNCVWTIEEGEETGLHLHVILFYSAESNHDEYITKLIGEYWVKDVTEGKGDYWNSNDGKLKKGYEEKGHGVGVGQINWNDVAKREALRANLVYLAKTEQYLMAKSPGRIRTFGMGQMPKQKVKSGRPRVKREQVCVEEGAGNRKC